MSQVSCSSCKCASSPSPAPVPAPAPAPAPAPSAVVSEAIGIIGPVTATATATQVRCRVLNADGLTSEVCLSPRSLRHIQDLPRNTKVLRKGSDVIRQLKEEEAERVRGFVAKQKEFADVVLRAITAIVNARDVKHRMLRCEIPLDEQKFGEQFHFQRTTFGFQHAEDELRRSLLASEWELGSVSFRDTDVCVSINAVDANEAQRLLTQRKKF